MTKIFNQNDYPEISKYQLNFLNKLTSELDSKKYKTNKKVFDEVYTSIVQLFENNYDLRSFGVISLLFKYITNNINDYKKLRSVMFSHKKHTSFGCECIMLDYLYRKHNYGMLDFEFFESLMDFTSFYNKEYDEDSDMDSSSESDIENIKHIMDKTFFNLFKFYDKKQNKYIMVLDIISFYIRFSKYINIWKDFSKYSEFDIYIVNMQTFKVENILTFKNKNLQVLYVKNQYSYYVLGLQTSIRDLMNLEMCDCCDRIMLHIHTNLLIKCDNYGNYNELIRIFNYYKFNFDYEYLTKNPNITFDIIDQNPHIHWRYHMLCENENISIQDTIDNLHYDWYGNFGMNNNFSFDELLSLESMNDILNKHYKMYEICKSNTNITKSIIENYIHDERVTFNIQGLSFNPNFNLNIVKQLEHIINWNYNHLLGNDSITENDIEYLIQNKKITNFYNLHNNNSITFGFIKKYQHILKKYHVFNNFYFKSRSININELLKDKLSDKYLIAPYHTTIEHIKQYPNKKWYWREISENPNIRLIDIKNNMYFPWDINGLSLNPNITLDFMIEYKEKKWNLSLISRNLFSKHPHFHNCVNIIIYSIRRFFIMHKYKMLKIKDELECMPSKNSFCGGIVFQEIMNDLIQ